jgi:biopolymer transport protein ExbD
MDIFDPSAARGHDYEPASALLSREEELGEFLPPSRLRRSGRRHWQEPVLNITSFVDVLSVLLFFLLSVATLEKLGAHNVNLPQQTDELTAESKLEVRNLSVSLARDGLKLRGLAVPDGKDPEGIALELPLVDGEYDVERLRDELLRLKATYRTDDAIILMVGDDVNFDWIVRIMDTVREQVVYDGGSKQVTKLFPAISLSDYLLDFDQEPEESGKA